MSGQGGGANSAVQGGQSPAWAQQAQPFAGPQGFGARRQAIFNERQMGGGLQGGNGVASSMNQQMPHGDPLMGRGPMGGGLMAQIGQGGFGGQMNPSMRGGQMGGQMVPQGGNLQNLIGGGQTRPMFNKRMMGR